MRLQYICRFVSSKRKKFKKGDPDWIRTNKIGLLYSASPVLCSKRDPYQWGIRVMKMVAGGTLSITHPSAGGDRPLIFGKHAKRVSLTSLPDSGFGVVIHPGTHLELATLPKGPFSVHRQGHSRNLIQATFRQPRLPACRNRYHLRLLYFLRVTVSCYTEWSTYRPSPVETGTPPSRTL